MGTPFAFVKKTKSDRKNKVKLIKRKGTNAMKKTKLFTRILSMVLSLLLIFYVIPSTVYAEIASLSSSLSGGICSAAL